MIKSTFSRSATKLPAPCATKKPSLASLAQKLQDVSLNGTSGTECIFPNDGLSNPLLLYSFTDAGDSVSNSGRYTRTSVLVHSNEDYCSIVGGSVPESVLDPVFCPASQPISSRDVVDSAVATGISKQDGNESADERCNTQNKCGAADTRSLDCSLEFGRMHINPAPQMRHTLAQPTPFGRTLSAVPNPLNRADCQKQKAALHVRFSYSRQTGAVGKVRQQRYSSCNAQTLIPFDFSTPSPDDIVRKKQKLAFGKRASAKQS